MSIAVPWGRRRDSLLELVPRVDLTTGAVQLPSVGVPASRDVRRASWQRSYVACLLGLDAVAALVAAAWTVVVTPVPAAALLSPVPVIGVVAWLGLLATRRLYEFRHLLVGTAEYRRLVGTGLVALVLVALVDSLWAVPHRGALFWVLAPTAVATDVGLRAVARGVVRYRQRRGQLLQRTIVVGPHGSLAELVTRLQRDVTHGMEVIGACYLDRDLHLRPVPTRDLGGVEDILLAARILSADVILVAASPQLSGPDLRRLAWELERTGAELVIAPGIVEVASPRLTVRSVTSLPLLHVDRPRHSGISYAVKTATDRLVALLLLLMAAPALVGLAVLIRRDGGGSLYRQVRIGQDGRPFTMLKLRTMCQNAEQRRTALLAEGKQHDGPLFKLRDDPRVTPIGRVLRKYSLDELPQLINVVRGDMSLVGPRPQLPDEVAAYAGDDFRRLRVKPGVTGLWQVNGRADLSWEETIRLDLRYVDNWSLGLDLRILWRTAQVVVRGAGAY